ncbi:hypothetical protein [Mesotoga sp. UBA5847]|jgi:hypothetical protein|uniref:hypothetical protein n=1 Tax=Mesotoga sp. UBA5847 TaxID=1946859 RepID=UPI0025F2CD54|nr:hypothetical protein [Mesotoga sp. UBA5847]
MSVLHSPQGNNMKLLLHFSSSTTLGRIRMISVIVKMVFIFINEVVKAPKTLERTALLHDGIPHFAIFRNSLVC